MLTEFFSGGVSRLHLGIDLFTLKSSDDENFCEILNF